MKKNKPRHLHINSDSKAPRCKKDNANYSLDELFVLNPLSDDGKTVQKQLAKDDGE